MQIHAHIYVIDDERVSVEVEADSIADVHPGMVASAIREQHAELVGDRQLQVVDYVDVP